MRIARVRIFMKGTVSVLCINRSDLNKTNYLDKNTIQETML